MEHMGFISGWSDGRTVVDVHCPSLLIWPCSTPTWDQETSDDLQRFEIADSEVGRGMDHCRSAEISMEVLPSGYLTKPWRMAHL